MLDMYTNTDQTVTTGSPLEYNTNRILTGCTATHSVGSAAVNLNKPGIYIVHFNADAAENGTAGDITIQLFNNGVLVPGAEATETSSALTDIVNLDFETAVRVTKDCCQCGNAVSLTFVNTGVDAVVSNTEVVVTKVC